MKNGSMSVQSETKPQQSGRVKRFLFQPGLQTRMSISYVWVTAVLALLLEVLGLLLLVTVIYPIAAPKLVDDLLVNVMRPNVEQQAQIYALEASVLSNSLALDPRLTFEPGQAYAIAPPRGVNSAIFGNTPPNYDLSIAILVSPDHRIIASSHMERYPIGADVDAQLGLLPNMTTLVEQALSGEPGSEAQIVGTGGIFAASEPVWNRENKTIGAIYIEQRASSLLEIPLPPDLPELFSVFILSGIFLLILITVIGGVFGILTTRGLVHRVQNLAAATLDFASGDYTRRVQVLMPDELGQLEQQFNNMAGQLVESIARRQELAEENARLAERARISRELHDAISQDLYSLRLLVGGLLTALPADSPVFPQLSTLQRTITTINREMRALLLELRPAQLESLGGTEALEDLAAAYRDRLGITITTTIASLSLPARTEHTILRIVQEALSNAARHANASAITLTLQPTEQGVQLTIEDNGSGFVPEPQGTQHGLGLRSMRERVEELQGNFELHTVPGQGTHIQVYLPNVEEAR